MPHNPEKELSSNPKIGIALSPFLFEKFSVEESLFRMEEIKERNNFEVVELQFQQFIRVGDEKIPVNDIKLRKKLPPILKKHRFNWTFHDDYRLGGGKVEELLSRYKFYKELVKNPTVSIHFVDRGNEKDFEQTAIEDGKKIREKTKGAKLYLENNAYLPARQPFSDVNKVAEIIRKINFDGFHLDIPHYLDSKDYGGTTELSEDSINLVKYVHVSGCEKDLKKVFPKRWNRVSQVLRKYNGEPRHLPLVKNSLSSDMVSRLHTQSDAQFYVLEIDPKRMFLIGVDIWKAYSSSISLLSAILKK